MKRYLIPLVLAGAVAQAVLPPEKIMGVDNIRPGMTGYGLTVFEGSDPERFDVRVLSVIKNIRPRQDMILCRLLGDRVKKTGVLQGMSGSPVYINGKLIGAVAFAFPFAREPVCGLQPIRQMLRIGKPSAKTDQAARLYQLTDWITARQEDPPAAVKLFLSNTFATGTPVGEKGFHQLKIPLTLPPMSGELNQILQTALKGPGNLSYMAKGGKGVVEAKKIPLIPGGVLTIPLIRGDMNAAAIGTITAVNGDRIWGFGHPFFGKGEIELPVSAGFIHGSVPSIIVGFKLGSPVGPVVGTLTRDESSGVFGRLGPAPKGIDVSITIRRRDLPDPTEQTYRCRIAHHRQLTPLLLLTTVGSALTARVGLPREHTIHYQLTTRTAGGREFAFNNISSGSGGMDILLDILMSSAMLLNNRFEPQRLTAATLRAEVKPRRRTATIRRAWLLNERTKPGQTVRCMVELEPYREPRRLVRIELKLPDDLDEGIYRLTVGNWRTRITAMFMQKPYQRTPDNLDQLFRQLNRVGNVKKNRLYCQMPLPGRTGLAFDAVELPDLPPSRLAILSGPTGNSFSQALYAEKETPYVLTGTARLRLIVKKQSGSYEP